jgi:hypothetical protein
LTKNIKESNNKDLQQGQNVTYKPAYKKIPKEAKNELENVPDDLAEIVRIWASLPQHIKQAINALIQGYTEHD